MRNAKVNTYTTAALILPNNIGLELPVLDPYDNGIIEDTALWEPDERVLAYAVHDDDPIEFEWGEGYWTGCELDDIGTSCIKIDDAGYTYEGTVELDDNEYWIEYYSHGPYGNYSITDEPTGRVIRILADDITDPYEHVIDVLKLYSDWCNGETYRIVRAEYDTDHKLIGHESTADVIGNDNIDGEIVAEMSYG